MGDVAVWVGLYRLQASSYRVRCCFCFVRSCLRALLTLFVLNAFVGACLQAIGPYSRRSLLQESSGYLVNAELAEISHCAFVCTGRQCGIGLQRRRHFASAHFLWLPR